MRRINRKWTARGILFMAALRSRCGNYIFPFGFFFNLLLSFFLSSPNLSRRRLDVCHTCTHGVVLVRNVLHAAR